MQKIVFSSWQKRLTVLILVSLSVFIVEARVQTLNTPPEGLTVTVNGMEMYYEEYGQGQPLVLLHGFGGSGQVWKVFIPGLAKYFRVIVPDLRGHGRSNNPTNQFTHRQSALDIFALLDKLQVRQFMAMGISTGGMTLIHMATQQPERVERMALIGSTIYFPEQAREIMRRTTVDSLTPKDWEELRRIHLHGDDQIRALRTQFHNFKDSYDDMNFTRPYLSTIKAKTLIIHGDRDGFFPVSIPVEMYESIPQSYLWIVPNGDHVPIDDQPQAFADIALKFLRGEWEKK